MGDQLFGLRLICLECLLKVILLIDSSLSRSFPCAKDISSKKTIEYVKLEKHRGKHTTFQLQCSTRYKQSLKVFNLCKIKALNVTKHSI